MVVIARKYSVKYFWKIHVHVVLIFHEHILFLIWRKKALNSDIRTSMRSMRGHLLDPPEEFQETGGPSPESASTDPSVSCLGATKPLRSRQVTTANAFCRRRHVTILGSLPERIWENPGSGNGSALLAGHMTPYETKFRGQPGIFPSSWIPLKAGEALRTTDEQVDQLPAHSGLTPPCWQWFLIALGDR